ncbi:MFS transporter [Streptomyces sp. SCA3-4]|uniref:MFS transporter n=1 Tax=Streptomyces sichuanensis TaxID=2871810 RepID=UPI001CE3642D|nr:MFS transporter [Streptomyces sichuanensis]MCA6091315.1 MFS transporter [Streptomyces sichuanensis]
MSSTSQGPLPRLMVSAMIVDAVGSGMFMPFALLYFVRVQHLGVGTVGTTLTVANLVLILASAPLGRLVQTYGSMRSLIAGNAVRAPLFVLYALTLPAPVAVGALVLSAVLDKAVWVSLGATIARLARGPQARRAFSTVGWARNIGLCLGSLAGGALASAQSATGLRVIVLINAVSFAVTAAALLRLRGQADASAPAAGEEAARRKAEREPTGGGALQVLRLPGFALLSAAKTCFAVCATVVSMFTGLYLVDHAGLDGWAAGTVLAVNGGLVVLLQQSLVKRTADRPAPRMMLAGGALYAVSGLGFALIAPLGDTVLPAVTLAVALVAMTLYTLGEIVIAPASDGYAADLAEPGSEATCMSVYQASWSLASVAVPVAGSWLLIASASAIWIAFTAVALLGTVLSALLARTRAPASAPA